ncbi:acyltransferase [Salmonella enterica subsp. enterica]|nr:acyltransferase [Salmonella enterica subsp. enterica]
MKTKKWKVIFADQLRVVAFISVVFVHWFSSYFDSPGAISYITNINAESSSNPNVYSNLLPPLTHFNYGPFGVAIFFLISGFVIPFSLYTKSVKGFIESRFLRIFPTYIACAVISMLVSFIISHYVFGENYNHDIKQILLNLSLTHSIFSMISIDAANWTLAIEIKFYLISALIYESIRNGKVYGIYIFCILSSMFLLLTYNKDLSFTFATVLFDPKQLSQEFIFISYMFIGTIFNMHFRKALSKKEASVSVILMITFVILMWRLGHFSEQVPSTSLNYIYALVIFTVCYLMRDRFVYYPAIAFLSAISFPFYALNSIIGFTIIRLFDVKFGCYWAGLIAALIITFGFSVLIHYTIERWSINLGKKRN